MLCARLAELEVKGMLGCTTENEQGEAQPARARRHDGTLEQQSHGRPSASRERERERERAGDGYDDAQATLISWRSSVHCRVEAPLSSCNFIQRKEATRRSKEAVRRTRSQMD